MMASHVRELEATLAGTDPEPIVHLVCCLDEDRSFCGTPVDGPATSEEPVSCVVCRDLWATHGGCPYGHGCTPFGGPR